MAQQSNLDDLSDQARAQNLVRVIERFISTFTERAGSTNVVNVLESEQPLHSGMINQEPERFVADEMIAPILDVLGYEYRFEPTGFEGMESKYPDFTLLNLSIPNFGEIKTPGGAVEARKETYGYLSDVTVRPVVGISTDGFVWTLHAADEGEPPSYRRQATLFELFRKTRMIMKHTGEQRHPFLREKATKFVSEFNREAVESVIDDDPR